MVPSIGQPGKSNFLKIHKFQKGVEIYFMGSKIGPVVAREGAGFVAEEKALVQWVAWVCKRIGRTRWGMTGR